MNFLLLESFDVSVLYDGNGMSLGLVLFGMKWKHWTWDQDQEQWPFFRQCVTLTSISVVGLTEYHTCLSTGKEMKRRCKMIFVTTIAFYSTRNRLIMRWSPQSTRRFVTLRILSGSIGNGERFVEVWKEWWGRVDCKGEGREGWEASLLLVHQDTLPWSFKQPSTPTTRSQTERLRLNETINSKGMIRFLWYHWVFYRCSNGKRPYKHRLNHGVSYWVEIRLLNQQTQR